MQVPKDKKKTLKNLLALFICGEKKFFDKNAMKRAFFD
jgi:hypothetical protein